MVAALNIENFCAALKSAAFVAFTIGLCNQGFSAPQYALLSSLQAFNRDILTAPPGSWKQQAGLHFPDYCHCGNTRNNPVAIFAPWNPKPATMTRPGLEDEEK